MARITRDHMEINIISQNLKHITTQPVHQRQSRKQLTAIRSLPVLILIRKSWDRVWRFLYPEMDQPGLMMISAEESQVATAPDGMAAGERPLVLRPRVPEPIPGHTLGNIALVMLITVPIPVQCRLITLLLRPQAP